ncbi:MAG: 3'-5' exonuclease domain-containing protein 2 [Bacteroidaceae bacterium]|nr:3'-5' exonuclease domain-containing protein 2 [Bacteroidaceae bacterium]
MKIFNAHIEKAEISTMPNVLFDGRIFVIDTIADTEKAVKALSKERIIGIDTETRPAFKKGVHYNVSLLQLSTADTCFLFRLCRTGIPDALIQLLENKEITKVGLSLHDDYQALKRRRAFTPGGFLDLQKHVSEFGIEEMSLQKIYAIVFGQRISKNQQLSNWDIDVLTDKQKLYAATDAWACLNIYNRLEQVKKGNVAC